jgi:hypothetical protein
MVNNFNDAEKNIKEFLEKKGKEGYVRLFLSNFLFEFMMYWLRSEDDENSLYNTAFKFHLKGKNIASLKDTEDYQKKIKEVCKIKADKIVDKLKNEKIIEEIDSFSLDDPKINTLIQTVIEEVFEEVNKDGN